MKYRQLKQEKKEEVAFNNNKAVRSLYGMAHILKMEVMKQIRNDSNIDIFTLYLYYRIVFIFIGAQLSKLTCFYHIDSNGLVDVVDKHFIIIIFIIYIY